MNFTLRPSPKLLIVFAAVGWVFWPTGRELYAKWMSDPQYSHGVLVPLFALYLLFKRPFELPVSPKARPVAGMAILLVSCLANWASSAVSFLTLGGLALVGAIVGVIVTSGGWRTVRALWAPLVFLLFMIPLPYSVERMMGAELQRLAVIAGTFTLQCLGQPAISEGNTILINEVRLGVVEACSGLRMLVTFAAFCTAAVMLMDRAWVVKLLVLLSAVPIALFANIVRITATGLAHVWLHDAEQKVKVLDFIHDFNGWMMMPIGLCCLMLELWFFKHLLLERSATAVPARTPSANTYGPPQAPQRSAATGGTKPRRISVIRMPESFTQGS